MADELAFLSGRRAGAARARGRRLVARARRDLPERIERLDPALNAYVTVCSEEASPRPESAPAGAVLGRPAADKDLTETAGIRTTPPRARSPTTSRTGRRLVRRVRNAGFVVLGKTNTPEFGTTAVTESGLNGICRNPWDPERTPGGSSGGAAAAVAAALALARTRLGRRRLDPHPGVVLRPLRAEAVPRPHLDGAVRRRLRNSSNGSLARTVADAAAFLDIVAGPCAGRPVRGAAARAAVRRGGRRPPGRLRVALVLEPPHPIAGGRRLRRSMRATPRRCSRSRATSVEEVAPRGGARS